MLMHAKALNISDPVKFIESCPLSKLKVGLIAAVLCRGILDSLTKE